MNLVSFVIPCYNSSETIENVVTEICNTMSLHKKYTYEIILVNDNSTDNTFSKISNICKIRCEVTGINLSRNFGQHGALMAGFQYIHGDIIVCLDDDGQTPENEVIKLIERLSEDCDVVYASYNDKKHSFFRNFGSTVNEKMARFLIGKPKDLYISSYFSAKRFVIEEVKKYKNPYPYVIGLVLRSTCKISNIPIEHRERKIGTSGYTLKKLLSLWFNGFTAFSVRPLRIATVTGLIFSLSGLLYGIYLIIRKLFNPEVVIGWSSLMVTLLVIGGIILFVLGLIGEYIGRIYLSINNSPQYVIKDIIKK